MSESSDKDSDQTNVRVYDVNGIKILLYNVYGLPPLVRSFCGKSYTQQRIEDIFFNQSEEPGFLKDYDVACFCEVFTDYTKLYVKIVERLKELGFSYFISGPKRSVLGGKFIGGGLFLCSKLPIKRKAFMTFSSKNNYFYNIDSFAAKGVIYAMIELDDSYHLHLTLTHAQSTYDDKFNRGDKGVNIRQHQFSSLAHFLSEQLKISSCSPLDPIVVLGDFNVPAFNPKLSQAASSQEYLKLLETLSLNHKYKVADLIYHASGNSHPVTWVSSLKNKSRKDIVKKPEVGQRLDYIFQLTPISNQPKSDNILLKYLMAAGNDYVWDFVPSSSKVKEFYANKSLRRKYSTLSDHYALTALLCVKKANFEELIQIPEV